ncbi:MerR family transcriptional regulator [Listeria grandensis]|uniref:MerR family transcriptional regulator n=1 Tax=Listeria grandensis TaxID=1494963 RepID=A0A7X0Y5C6_9LIST|nr:MerR family transcriptional regulator [Listeria grandensis]MBC1474722.1 MerR family transcriptional regulator [Listeria grandensis]MBC1937229.1 MerR family transcriptional regulator [Listeria grandensis]
MNAILKIGELAQLMNVSIYQIRYFEEKGVFSPAYVDANGYHMYGLDEIYSLSNILLLRNLDISVPEIKTLMEKYTPEESEQLLQTALSRLEDKIIQLQHIKSQVETVLADAPSKQNTSQIKHYPERHFQQLKHDEKTGDVDLHHLKDLARHSGMQVFNSDIFYVSRNNTIETFLESPLSDDLILPASDYLVQSILISSEAELEKAISAFEKESVFELCPPLLILCQEKSYSSVFHPDHVVFDIQAKMEWKGGEAIASKSNHLA